MKKYILLLSFLWILFGIAFGISANQVISSENARKMMGIVQTLVNEGNGKAITEMISPNAGTGISQKILDAVEGKKIQFVQEFSSIQEYGSGMYKVVGKYSAKGLNWEVSGLSNYYVLEIDNGEGYIIDTDFFQFVPDIMNTIIQNPLFKLFPFFIFSLVIFWFWMLIDLSKRQIDSKWIWYCLLFFVPFGSVIYFFTGHKKYPKLEKYR